MGGEFDNLLRLLNSREPEQMVLGAQIGQNYKELCTQRLGADAGSYVACKLLGIEPQSLTMLRLVHLAYITHNSSYDFLSRHYNVIGALGIPLGFNENEIEE